MIQRIQTIYLAVAAVCCLSLFGLPFATTNEVVNASPLFADGRYTIADNLGLIFLFVGAALLALGSIFLYNNRALQNNLTRVGTVGTIIGLVLGILLFLRDDVTKTQAEPNDGLGIFMPILAIVCFVLALRSIKKDEKLVRSADRFRE